MAKYNLFDSQKQVLQEMVAALKAGCRPEFSIDHSSTFEGVILDGVGVHRQIECSIGDLIVLDNKSLIRVMSRDGGVVLPEAVTAVENEFAAPSVRTTIAIGNFINQMQGGTAQSVIGDNANQSAQITIANILAGLKAAGVPQPERNEIENLMDHYEVAGPQERLTIRARFEEWLTRNSGHIGEFAGGLLRGIFDIGS